VARRCAQGWGEAPAEPVPAARQEPRPPSAETLVGAVMRVTHVEKLTNEKWLNLFAASYEHNGHKGRWVYASRKSGPAEGKAVDAVVIVPVLHEAGRPPRLVMIREFRIPLNDYSLAFPAGLLEKGESVEECVRREMLEETGLE